MNAEMLSNEVDVDLISEGIKYSLKVRTPIKHTLYKDTSINRTFSSVSNVTFVYLTTSEMRTPL